MNEFIRLLVVDDKVELRQNIRRLLSLDDQIDIVGEACDGSDAINKARRLRPDIILMDIRMPVMDGIEASSRISSDLPETNIVMMSVKKDAACLRQSMQAGARDFLVKPFSGDDLVDTIKSVFRAARIRRASLRPVQARTVSKTAPGGQLITVFGAKGGLGKTTIALNLAIALRKYTGKRVIVADLDLYSADVGVMLNLASDITIFSLVQEVFPWENDLVSEHIVKHADSGIDVLLGPERPELAEAVSAEHVEAILNYLREKYDYVIIDSPPFFHETELTILDASSVIMLLVSLELSAIKNTRLCLELLENLHYKNEKIMLVLNRGYPPMGGLNVEDIETSLRRKVCALIPSGGAHMARAESKGSPIVLSQPRSDTSLAIFQLATSLARMNREADRTQTAAGTASSILDRFGAVFSASSA